MAKANKVSKAVKASINAETQRALELLDSSAMLAGSGEGTVKAARAEMGRALRLLGFKYANDGTNAVASIKSRAMMHYTAGWLKGNGLADNADAVRGTTPGAYDKLEGKASDIASPKGRAKIHKAARDSAFGMTWLRACDDADPDGAVVRKADATAKREKTAKDKAKTDKGAKGPKTPKATQTIECDAALYAAFVAIAKDADLAKDFMAWAATAIPDA